MKVKLAKKRAAVMAILALMILNSTNVYAVDTMSANDVSTKIETLIKNYSLPIGGALVFGAVVVCALSLIISAHNAQKRTEKMSTLLWIGIGAAVLGFASLIAGFMLGVSK